MGKVIGRLPLTRPIGSRARSFMTRARWRREVEGYIAIMPWLIGFVVFQAGPLVYSLVLSLCDWDLLGDVTFSGLANYRAMVHDPLFWQSLKVTGIYTLFSVPLGIAVGFTIALLMNQKVRGIALWRTIYYMPSVMPAVAVALLWVWVFNPDYGIINILLRWFGIEGPKWIFDRTWALPSLIIMSLWVAGGGMVIYLAGLQGIPTQLYEAAEIDGANGWVKLTRITLPMMSPVLFFQLIMGFIGTFQTFTSSFVMTGGGPANATLFYVLYLYRNAFQYFRMAYASALAWVLFLIILACTLILFKSARFWVYYEGTVRK